ncbi:MAG: hypothetical protein ABSH32_16945 [Bryobacteraceae bacterium]|jgi:hypothetical protein
MGDRILQILDFFIERPPLTGALVWGALYMLKRTRKAHMTTEERQHTLKVYESQRTYAEKMYDPPTEEEQSAKLQPHK